MSEGNSSPLHTPLHDWHVAHGGRMVEFALEWGACPQGAVARVIVDGEEARSWPCSGQGRHEWRLRDDQGGWCLVEVRDRGDRMLALTNPIYSRPPVLRG